MLASMRRSVAPPNEITGNVIDTGDGDISTVVRWLAVFGAETCSLWRALALHRAA